MDQSKFFRIDANGVPIANMPVYPSNTIEQLKTHVGKMYPNMVVQIYINNSLINDNNLLLSEYWDKIAFGIINVNNVPIKNVPINNVPEIRVRNVERGVSYPNVAGFNNIPGWSRGAKPWKDLSPFTIGPVIFEEDGQMKHANIFENFYQSMEVWKQVDKQKSKNWNWSAEIHVGPDNLPNDNWRKWQRSHATQLTRQTT